VVFSPLPGPRRAPRPGRRAAAPARRWRAGFL